MFIKIIGIVMKKTTFLLILLLPALVSFAQEVQSRSVYVEGTATEYSHYYFFMDNFEMEASFLGFDVVNYKPDAGFIFRFDAVENGDEYMLIITLILNEGDVELVSFGQPYKEIEEMYLYNQFIFFKAAVMIPGIDESELFALLIQNNEKPDLRWRNKFLYIRTSFEFPISFYSFLPDGLKNGNEIYKDLTTSIPIDNRIVALPALTIGLEFQLFNFLSIEPKIMAGWERLNNADFLMLNAGVNLKTRLNLSDNIVLSPYGAFTYPLFFLNDIIDNEFISGSKDIFDSFPKFGIGGGIQLNMKAGTSGAFFIDVNYMYYIGKTGIHNDSTLAPNPSVINYQRSVLGLGIGYKLGLINRKQQR